MRTLRGSFPHSSVRHHAGETTLCSQVQRCYVIAYVIKSLSPLPLVCTPTCNRHSVLKLVHDGNLSLIAFLNTSQRSAFHCHFFYVSLTWLCMTRTRLKGQRVRTREQMGYLRSRQIRALYSVIGQQVAVYGCILHGVYRKLLMLSTNPQL
ncbi:hypothetical protein BDY19DRAFT_923191 [Irpex rosettiformis]|uniref:Uncharacterized protein n=1 Tax=Irpex rosettiformis TaxID=378272 RepID=A0ACB8UGA3_9APHY|nr:hypothetical protein BDY19DRAFT_923191 [Irpex rosettiformis]